MDISMSCQSPWAYSDRAVTIVLDRVHCAYDNVVWPSEVYDVDESQGGGKFEDKR